MGIKIGIVGATGFLGGEVVRVANAAGHSVIGYSRRADREIAGAVETRSLRHYDVPDFTGLDALVVVAGTSVFGWWTETRKASIRSSRVGLLDKIRARFEEQQDFPKVLVSASAVGYYGNRGDEILTESAAAGTGFLAETCIEWEAAARAFTPLDIRVAIPRIGMVLGRDGIANKLLGTAFGLGLGGFLGDGTQWMPWIHVHDVARLILEMAVNDKMTGIFNATGPEPVTNAEFTKVLAHTMHRPAWFNPPAELIRAGMGEASEILLGSTRAIPEKALGAGFHFHYPTLADAAKASFGKKR